MKFRRFIITTLLGACSCSVVQKQGIVSEQQVPKSEKAPYFVSVPITKFSSIQTPCINVEIEGKIVSMELDLGFRGDISSGKDMVHCFSSKTFIGEKPMFGVRGKEYTHELYRIPKVKIGAMTFSPSVIEIEDGNFLKDATFMQNGRDPSPREEGRLGWMLFCNVNLLVDVKNSRIAFCDSLGTLKKAGYPTESLVKAPLLLGRGLVEFEAITPQGSLICALDTGATWNVLNQEIENENAIWEPKNIVEYAYFQVKGSNLGPIAFHQMPIRIPIHIYAILGMEFFNTHLVFLDFENKSVYFSKDPN